MAISRKQALKRLLGLAIEVENHLAKRAADPTHSSVAHWEREIRNWLKQMEEVLPHAGQKTSSDWKQRIENYQAQLGE